MGGGGVGGKGSWEERNGEGFNRRFIPSSSSYLTYVGRCSSKITRFRSPYPPYLPT